MKRHGHLIQFLLWSTVVAFVAALIAAGTLTNVTLRSVEKNLPNVILRQLTDLQGIMEDLQEVVSIAALTRAVPRPENHQKLRERVEAVHSAVIALRNTYVFDNMIQASAFHAVVAPAVADVRLWLSEGVSGYGPESLTTHEISLSRITLALEQARSLYRESESAAQEMLNEQRDRLDRFLFSVNALFALTVGILLVMVGLLIRQHVLQRLETQAQAERLRVEAALHESEARFRELAEHLPETIFEMDTSGKLTFVNQNAFAHFGYSQEDFDQGLNAFQMIVSEDRPKALANVRRVLSGENIGINEYTALRKDGSTFPAVMHSSARYRDGKPVGLQGFVIDVTETKKLEAQLRQAHKMEAIGTLAGGIAHDFNNLLQAIQGFTELLLLDKGPDEHGYAELLEISRAAQRGGELTRQLLTFSRKVEVRFEPTDLNQAVKGLKRLLERTIPKMIRIDLRLTADPYRVMADGAQIEQVVMNLAVNARDAMPDGGALAIETQNVALDEGLLRRHSEMPAGRYAVLAVSDTGHGMDTATQEHIFDPFFTTKDVGKGTGLGLAMVYGIVKAHRGHVTCESTPGVGTTFRIYLPALESRQEAAQTPSEPTEELAGTETILLVDDEEPVRHLGERVLQRFGYTVISASDGESALKTYREQRERIDLVILDLIMPGIGGRKCLQELIDLDPQVRVIVVSGHGGSEEIEDTRTLGARSFVRKPYDVHQLLKLVRHVLG